MAEDIFGDLITWWLSNNSSGRTLKSPEESLAAAFQYLEIMRKDEVILSREISVDWHQESEDVYTSIAVVNLESPKLIRTVRISAYAVVTPPGLSIENRIDVWKKRVDRLVEVGVLTPKWYLVWRGTIFAYYPPHGLGDYLSNFDLSEFDLTQIAIELARNLRGLAQLSLKPLNLLHNLRTDSIKVFYCGLGFDIGESSLDLTSALVREYEANILPKLPQSFRVKYSEVTNDQI